MFQQRKLGNLHESTDFTFVKPQVNIYWLVTQKLNRFSAKTGENVEEAFLETARQIYQKIQEGSLELNAADSGVQTRQQETILFFQISKMSESNLPACFFFEYARDNKCST